MNNFSLRCSTFLVLILLIGFSSIAQPIQEKKISGVYKNVPLKVFFNELEQKERINAFFKDQWIDTVLINYSFDNYPLIQALNKIFAKSRLKFVFFQDDAILVYPKSAEQRHLKDNSGQNILIVGDPLNDGKYKKATIKGKVTDGATGEKLTGAIVHSLKIDKGITTDAKGEYEIELPTGEQELQVIFMGYEPNKQIIKLIESGTVNFEVYEETHNLGEVTIIGDENKVARTQMSVVKVNSKALKELPVLMGESDVIKSIITLPGVQSVGELSSGFNVRGGNTDQNLVLLNSAPVFNTSHLFGLFSMINPDIVNDVTLFKGGIPASYGERVSSVMEIDLKKGKEDKLTFYGGIGLVNSRLTLEGPFMKGKKSSFIIAGRSTYSDWLLKQTKSVDLINCNANFYDVNAKANMVIGKNNQVNIMLYNSSDGFTFNSGSIYEYKNLLGSLNWNFNLTSKLLSDLSLAYSQYDFKLNEQNKTSITENYILKNGINYRSAQYRLSYIQSEKHRLNIGTKYINYKLRPGEVTPEQEISSIIAKKIADENSVETSFFIDDEFNFTPKIILNLGLRYTSYFNRGPSSVYLYDTNYTKNLNSIIDTITYEKNEKIKQYSGFEPRFSFRYDINENRSFKASYQRINQYVHQISNNSVVSPTDFWKSCDTYIKPLQSDQFAIGLNDKRRNGKYELSIEMYYKFLKNLPEYKNGATLIMNEHLETALIQCNGYSYGVELFAKKALGKLNGWLSYTYSKTMRQTDNTFQEETINQGKYFPSVYDKPHDLSIVGNYQISRRWRLSSNFELSSGRPLTLPEQKYKYGDVQIIYFSDRNKYRMPAYHRLDLSITFDENLKKKRSWKGSWTFSIYNVYGRKNPYSVYYKRDASSLGRNGLYELYKLSVIGVPIPSITYNFKF